MKNKIIILLAFWICSFNLKSQTILKLDSTIEYYRISNHKIKKIYYHDSKGNLHPKVSRYRRNGNLKFIYFYKHGRFQYYLEFKNDKLENSTVIKDQGLKIDRTKSTHFYIIDSSKMMSNQLNVLNKNGNKDGLWFEIIFIKNNNNPGGKNLYSKGNYINGKKIGKWENYHLYGKQLYSIETFKNDTLDGEMIFFDRSGIIRASYIYSNGLKNGPYFVYYRNGKIKVKSTFKNDEFYGEYIEYKKNGKIKRVISDASTENPYYH